MGRPGRLTSSADFRRTYAEGRRVATTTVIVHARETGEDRAARVGVSVARGFGGAVRRNRVKRRLREAVRLVRAELRPGVDAVLVGTAATGRAGYQDLVDNLRRALTSAGARS